MQISATFEQLSDQASRVVNSCLYDAQEGIDRVFGKGYAKEHPELVAAYIQAAGNHFNIASALKVLEGLVEGFTSRSYSFNDEVLTP